MPRAAAGDRLQLWVGAFERTRVPRLSWRLDGAPATPAEVRPIASVRPDAMLRRPDAERAFAGVYEFTGAGIRPNTRYVVEVAADDGGGDSLAVRTLPDEIPPSALDTFNVLLVSCFHQHEDRSHRAGQVVASLPVQYRPHLTLLLGDQVYLDLPTLQDFKPDVRWMADKFEKDYRLNWMGPEGYSQVLRQAPSVSTPDDHEYWNDFPRAQAFLQQTWSPEDRERWTAAAGAVYDGFQRHQQTGASRRGPAFEVDVRPLSLFVMDTRTNRRASKKAAECILSPEEMAQFGRWVDRLIEERLTGVLATGQSLLDGAVELSATDLTLATFPDYRQIVQHLARALDAGRPVMLVTGDVHWGRVLRAVDTRHGMPLLYEVISSPTSLVSFVGMDQVKKIGAGIAGLFGRKNPWPRHGDPGDPPAYVAREVLGSRLPVQSCLHRQTGNMVAILSFRRSNLGVKARVTYWPIHPQGTVSGPEAVVDEITLYPA